jgi:hypothetical protein
VISVDTIAPPAPPAPAIATDENSGSTTDAITNVINPNLSGNGAAADTELRVYRGSTLADAILVGSTVTDANGAWTIASTAHLGIGDYTIFAVTVDSAGNISEPSPLYSMTVVQAGPASAPTITGLAASSDSGTVGDLLTNASAIVIEGAGAVQGARVELFEGVASRGFATAGAGGAWSITVTGLSGQGAHTLTARSFDLAGNPSQADSSGFTFTYDTVAPEAPPSLAIVSADNSGASSTDNLTSVLHPDLAGSGAPANHVIRVYKGNGIVGESVLVGSTTANAEGAWTLIVSTGLPAGDHTLFAVAVDPAGNVSAASSLYALSIDGSAPAAPTSLALASASDTGDSSSDQVTKSTSLLITGLNAPAGGSVQLFEGSTSLGFATIDGSSWSRTVTSITSNGSHTIHAVAYDSAGNASGQSTALTVTLDTEAPATAASAPDLQAANDSGVSATDNITSSTLPTFAGTIPEAGRLVELYDANNVLRGSTVSTTGGNWSIATASAFTADATHTVTAYWYDQAGNKSPASGGMAFKVDTNSPQMVGDGTRAFNVAAPLQITFDEAVYVDSGHVNISYGSTQLQIAAGDIVFSNDHRTMTLLGANALNDDIDYTISFPASMTDAAGNLYNDGNIVLDTTAPGLVSTVPLTQSAFTGVIALTFNEAISFAAGGTISLVKSSNGQDESYSFTSSSGGWVINGNTITFNNLNLGFGTFHLTLDHAIADLVGNVNTSSLLSDLPLVINRPNSN